MNQQVPVCSPTVYIGERPWSVCPHSVFMHDSSEALQFGTSYSWKLVIARKQKIRNNLITAGLVGHTLKADKCSSLTLSSYEKIMNVIICGLIIVIVSNSYLQSDLRDILMGQCPISSLHISQTYGSSAIAQFLSVHIIFNNMVPFFGAVIQFPFVC